MALSYIKIRISVYAEKWNVLAASVGELPDNLRVFGEDPFHAALMNVSQGQPPRVRRRQETHCRERVTTGTTSA
jgi:hypothetical protein